MRECVGLRCREGLWQVKDMIKDRSAVMASGAVAQNFLRASSVIALF